MNITIIASGTRGDVQPAIALGLGLRERGHRVRLLASPNFHAWIADHGLEPAESRVDVQRMMESEGGVEWVERGHNPIVQQRLMKRLLDISGWELVWDAWQACRNAELVISSFTSDTYATAIAEKLGIPQVSALLQPALFATRDGRSVFNSPLPNRNSVLNYLFSKLFIEPFPWRMYGDLTNRLRRDLGLPPQSAAENLATRRALLTLQGYSAQVTPQPIDWPSHIHTTGYWFLDDQPRWEPDAALRAFLDAGSRPVYIGFGSMTGRDPQGTMALILEALAISGMRAVISAGWARLSATGLPETVHAIPGAPHERLFPLMAAVVHHGGAGTTAAGLRAGVPSVIVPHIVDQPYWGARVHALGAGPRPLPRRKLTAVALADALTAAVGDPLIAARSAEIGALLRSEDGVGRAVELIESHVTG